MTGEVKELRDQIAVLNKEIEPLTEKRKLLVNRLRLIQQTCTHEFKKGPITYWSDLDCILCGKDVL